MTSPNTVFTLRVNALGLLEAISEKWIQADNPARLSGGAHGADAPYAFRVREYNNVIRNPCKSRKDENICTFPSILS